MPWFHFDLLIDELAHSQGSMILEGLNEARDRADALVEELRKARPDLVLKGYKLRVVNEHARTVYTKPLDQTETMQNYPERD